MDNSRYLRFLEANPDFEAERLAEGAIEIRDGHWLWNGLRDPRGAAMLRCMLDGKRVGLRVAQIYLRLYYPDYRYTSQTTMLRIADCTIRHCVSPKHIKPFR